jgi:hypothetical protein
LRRTDFAVLRADHEALIIFSSGEGSFSLSGSSADIRGSKKAPGRILKVIEEEQE